MSYTDTLDRVTIPPSVDETPDLPSMDDVNRLYDIVDQLHDAVTEYNRNNRPEPVNGGGC